MRLGLLLILVSLTFGCADWIKEKYGPKDIGQLPDIGEFPDDFPFPPDDGMDDSDQSELPECVRDCYSKVCGPDRCGGTCGTCPSGTVCSFTQARCIDQASQKPLGAACAQNAFCEPYTADPLNPNNIYANSNWPGCLHDQCRDGDCINGFCSRTCTVSQDVRENGSAFPFPDGIEDDHTRGDCLGGENGPYGDQFICVQSSGDELIHAAGVCLPLSSFSRCTSSVQCDIEGESCGYIKIRDNIEARCVKAPTDAASTGQACGYDVALGVNRLCDSWNCSFHGCTTPCTGPESCMTAGAKCSDGKCEGTGIDCQTDPDCSAWVCFDDVALNDLNAYVSGCSPKFCTDDSQCGDPNYYCLHWSAAMVSDSTKVDGRCVLRLVGGALDGQECDVSPGNMVPDRPCANEAYCINGRCGSMCDDTCPLPESQRCGRLESHADITGDGIADLVLSIPNCIWVGESGAPCSSQADCSQGVCSPIAVEQSDKLQVELLCMEPPKGAFAMGTECGAGDATCDSRFCLDGNVCSTVCGKTSDCPSSSFIGSKEVGWVCESKLFNRAGSLPLDDDLYVSWCSPVPGGSSLASCGSNKQCVDPDEVCKAFPRFGAPVKAPTVDFFCVKATGTAVTGESCDPRGLGEECRSGICTFSALPGAGACSQLCTDDSDCASIPGAICANRTVVPRVDSPELTIPVCRIEDQCVRCNDDRDCGKDYHCINLGAFPWIKDFRCVLKCTVDTDCPLEEQVCQEMTTSLEQKRQACVPTICAGL